MDNTFRNKILNLECDSCREKVEQLASDVEQGITKFHVNIYIDGDFIHINELEAIKDDEAKDETKHD